MNKSSSKSKDSSHHYSSTSSSHKETSYSTAPSSSAFPSSSYGYGTYEQTYSKPLATVSPHVTQSGSHWDGYPYYVPDYSYMYNHGMPESSAEGYSNPANGYQYPTYYTPAPDLTKSKKHDPAHWITRDYLKKGAPYKGGKGMNLLKKMGWTPGQGLGKMKDGSLEPLLLDVKVDKRGFDVAKPRPTRKKYKEGGSVKTMHIVTEGKHPISILAEYCVKRKLAAPTYVPTLDEGPVHAKRFIFKVIVAGVEYEAKTGSHIKREAKTVAAKVCLTKLGLLSESEISPPPASTTTTTND